MLNGLYMQWSISPTATSSSALLKGLNLIVANCTLITIMCLCFCGQNFQDHCDSIAVLFIYLLFWGGGANEKVPTSQNVFSLLFFVITSSQNKVLTLHPDTSGQYMMCLRCAFICINCSLT